MNSFKLLIGGGLKNNTKLYKYISLSKFLTFIENNQTYLTNIASWEDTWEIPLKKLPVHLNDQKIEHTLFTYLDNMIGQCWSLEGNSDALWRIYSKQKEGILIETTVEKFKLIKKIKHAMLAPVIYYSDLELALDYIRKTYPYNTLFGNGFLKRKAFEHEKEVRFVTINEERCLDNKYDQNKHINFELDPKKFIENVIIDPRASDWYVNTIKLYCKRVGLNLVAQKSNLYSSDIFKSTGIEIQAKNYTK